MLLERAFDGGIVRLLSADNDKWNVKRIVKSGRIDDVESCEGDS